MAGTVVIAYDGSEDAKHAVTVAGETLKATRAVVVHVRVLPPPPIIGADPSGPQPESPDQLAQQHADRVLAEGEALAARAGFEIETLAATADSMTGVWKAVLDAAEKHDASTVVAGHRGLSRLQSALLGSVSNGLVNHSQVPVLVVPRGRE